jgi:hypothetical protein
MFCVLYKNIISSVSKHFVFEGNITLPLTYVLMGDLKFQSQILFKGQNKIHVWLEFTVYVLVPSYSLNCVYLFLLLAVSHFTC